MELGEATARELVSKYAPERLSGAGVRFVDGVLTRLAQALHLLRIEGGVEFPLGSLKMELVDRCLAGLDPSSSDRDRDRPSMYL